MKKLTLVTFVALSLFSCKKDNNPTLPYCQHCLQYVVDSASNDVIEIRDGDNSSSVYCDNTLTIVKQQPAVYFHNTVAYGSGQTSYVQKYYWVCK